MMLDTCFLTHCDHPDRNSKQAFRLINAEVGDNLLFRDT